MSVLQVFQISVDKLMLEGSRTYLPGRALHSYHLLTRGINKCIVHCFLLHIPFHVLERRCVHTYEALWTCPFLTIFILLSMTVKEAFENRRETLGLLPRSGFKADVAHHSCPSMLRGGSDIWITSLHEGKLFISH